MEKLEDQLMFASGKLQRSMGWPVKVRIGVGFSDATRNICVTRIVAWRRRSAQAGNRGFALDGAFVAMGIWPVDLSRIRPDGPDEGAPSGRARGAILHHMMVKACPVSLISEKIIEKQIQSR
ncbi:hypothetical protein EOK75_06740 [Pseudorhodobacter turbinis]|uniref:Uncharacterized protein n=1 Tax=Pseudorhodobacter turbinis TaxID=2500533 RepID=A0A4P8EFA1_9RHOB|nr:hypothetical protein [Pseudorhodobacter turbinis]QCO55477.1 hypothetical protein EOK75_06740 [Pseudorhodobacter turbinis]